MLAEVLKDIYEFDMNQLDRLSIPSSANSFIVAKNFSFKQFLYCFASTSLKSNPRSKIRSAAKTPIDSSLTSGIKGFDATR